MLIYIYQNVRFSDDFSRNRITRILLRTILDVISNHQQKIANIIWLFDHKIGHNGDFYLSHRYLLNIFIDARCLDWIILLSLMLSDISPCLLVIEKVATFKDFNTAKLNLLLEQLNKLYHWLDTTW